MWWLNQFIYRNIQPDNYSYSENQQQYQTEVRKAALWRKKNGKIQDSRILRKLNDGGSDGDTASD